MPASTVRLVSFGIRVYWPGLAGQRVDIAVDGVVTALVLQGEDEAGRKREHHRVGAGGEVGEQVVAVHVGLLRAEGVAAAVEQHDGDVGNAGSPASCMPF